MHADPPLRPLTDRLIWLCAAFSLWLTGVAWATPPATIPATIDIDTSATATVTITLTAQEIVSTAGEVARIEGVSWVEPPPGEPTPALQWSLADQHLLITTQVSAERIPTKPQIWPLRVATERDSVVLNARIDSTLTVVGPISRGQTLWSVANRWREVTDLEDDDTADRLARWVAANPHAFADDNPASLIQGALLVVPDQAFRDRQTATRVSHSDGLDRADARLTPSNAVEPDVLSPSERRQTGWVERAAPKRSATVTEPGSLGESGKPQTMETFDWDDPSAIGRLAWPVLSVVVGLMLLHGVAHRVLGQSPTPPQAVPNEADIGPGSPPTQWALAQWSAQTQDRSQALYWLDELILNASPKIARQAKRLSQQLKSDGPSDGTSIRSDSAGGAGV